MILWNNSTNKIKQKRRFAFFSYKVYGNFYHVHDNKLTNTLAIRAYAVEYITQRVDQITHTVVSNVQQYISTHAPFTESVTVGLYTIAAEQHDSIQNDLAGIISCCYFVSYLRSAKMEKAIVSILCGAKFKVFRAEDNQGDRWIVLWPNHHV